MFEDRSQTASSNAVDCCKNAASVKTEGDAAMSLLSVAKKTNDSKGCPCGCGGSGGCCGDSKAADKKNPAATKEKSNDLFFGTKDVEGKPIAGKKGDKTCEGCCPCCGASGGCCCDKTAGKKEAANKGEKDLVEKGIDYVNSAGFPKIASALKSIYEEGKSLLITPLDCCDPKNAAGKAGLEGCPCGCGGAGSCCAKPKDGKGEGEDKDKSLTIPPLDDKAKELHKKAKSKDCESCKCGCGGAGGCVCDSKKESDKAEKKSK